MSFVENQGAKIYWDEQGPEQGPAQSPEERLARTDDAGGGNVG